MTVRWHGDEVRRKLRAALEDLQEEILLGIAKQSEENVIGNNQIDTGHMKQSFYIVSPRQNTYRLTHPPGIYWGVKSRAFVKRERAPEITPAPGTSIVANSAPYALYPELRQSFMFIAALQVRKEMRNMVKIVLQRHGL